MPTGMRKAKTKNRTTVAGVKVIGGKKYKHKLCGQKAVVKSKAKAIRAKGGRARVVKVGTRYCLYTRANA